MPAKDDYTKLTGTEKAAIVLLTLSKENAARLFEMMEDEEIRELSHVMSTLGTVQPELVERLMFEFTGEMSASVSFVGNMQSTEKLLEQALGKERVDAIMEDIRGPAGRNTWDKLGNVSEEILASYLKNEYPQTAALIISKLQPLQAAHVLGVLPDEFTFEVMMRMLSMDAVKKEILDSVEKTLRAEFISTLTKTQKSDSNELMAEIFNNFDRNNEAKFMGMLEERNPEAAERIKNLMFTFEDLIKIDSVGIQALLRGIDKTKLAIALKGAPDAIRTLFISNMSARASKILIEDMEAMGPVRLRDVDEAQSEIVLAAKEMASKGEIEIRDETEEEDELVY